MRVASACRSIFLVTAALAALSGCQHLPQSGESNISGFVHGGQQPVSDSTIGLYAANPTVNAGPATLVAATTTDANGGFTLPRPYTCPSPTSSAYLVATGGNPGLGGNVTNPGIAVMAALGSCGDLTAATNVQMNELTTIAAVAQLYPYMTSYANVGATSQATLTSTFATIGEYVNFSTGAVPGATLPAGFYASQETIDTVGDIIAACINSDGTGPGCANLFSLSGSPAPTDTIGAAIYLFKNPSLNTSALYNLITPAAPFQPILPAAPSSFAVGIVPIPTAPVIAPAAGTYTTPQTVTLTAATGTSIYYTTNGTAPTESSTLYTAPFTVSANTTVQAIATASPGNDSSVASAAYTLNLTASTPSISSPSGTYNSPLSVTLSTTLTGASIYYTVDGTTPVPFASGVTHPAARAHAQASGGTQLYTGPISVQQSETITYLSSLPGYAPSPAQSATYTITLLPPTSTPTSATGSAFYADSVRVTLANSANGTNIYYTTDGSNPTTSSTVYNNPFTLTTTTTVKAILSDGPTSSTVATFAYVVKPTTITFTAPGGSYTGAQTVSILTNAFVGNSAGNAGLGAATGIVQNYAGSDYLYYSINGGTPVLYTGPISVPSSETITAGIADSGFDAAQSNYYRTATAAYTITNPIVATPVLSLASGTFGTFQSVSISESTPGAVVHYTLDGTTPTASSPVYSNALTVSTSETLQAIGILTGYTNSAVASATYNIVNIISTVLSGLTPEGLAIDSSNNLYVADEGSSNGYNDSTILKMTPAGVTSFIAGNGTVGFSGDGGPATSASMHNPGSIAISPNGTLYINDSFNELRYVSSGTINKYSQYTFGISLAASSNALYMASGGCALYLGNGANYPNYIVNSSVTCGYSGDGGLGINAEFSAINGVATTPGGQVYISDTGNNRIRTFLQNNNIVSTYAGTGTAGYSGDGGQATSAQIHSPMAIAVDPSGNVYFYDSGNARIRKISTSGVITTIAGNGTAGYSGDGGSALLASIHPQWIAVDSSGNVYLSNFTDAAVRKITIAH